MGAGYAVRSAIMGYVLAFIGRLWSKQTWFRIRQVSRSLWFRPAAYACAVILTLVLGPFFDPYIPAEYIGLLQENAVRNILDILASSMLAVAIFSLGTMVSAFQIAAQSATPRARPLVVSDRTAQSAISTFIGAFLFAILGIIGLSVQAFSGGARLILLGMAIMLVAVVLMTLIAWMQRLTHIGGVTEVIDQVEDVADKSFAAYAAEPGLGGKIVLAAPPHGEPVFANAIGHIQHIDADMLSRLAKVYDTDVYLFAQVGEWVSSETPLCQIYRTFDAEQVAEFCDAFVIGDQRTFEGDPTYALIVLSEIAERALSPAVNDTGTALNCLKTTARILVNWREAVAKAAPEVKHERLLVPVVDCNYYLEAGFARIMREGASNLEVGLVMRRCLALLQKTDSVNFTEGVKNLDARLLSRARVMMEIEDDFIALSEGEAPEDQ